MKKRILALLLSVAMLLTTGIGTTAFATEGAASLPGESCTHQHNEVCGYSEGTDCTHECGEDCGGLSLGDSGGLLLSDDGDSCVCTAYCNDPDCPVCKDDHTQCFFYYCVCESLCGEDSANAACPVCADDYTSCVQAVNPPEIAPLAADGSFEHDGGTGIQNDPYILTTEAQLHDLAEEVNDGTATTDVYFKLGGDIALTGGEWTPIGDTSVGLDDPGNREFKGVFDGAGHSITGLSITSASLKTSTESYLGLFGRLNGATVKNLTVAGEIDVTGNTANNMNAGGLAGSAYNSTLANCHSDVAVEVKNDGPIDAGGLAGTATSVSDCSATGDVTAIFNGSSGYTICAGGLLGFKITELGTGTNSVSGCYATGDVTATSQYSGNGKLYAGGLVAQLRGGNISGCYAIGDTSATDGDTNYAGGFAGYNGGTISGCYATGDATASGGTDNYAGGLAGYNDYNITDSYYAGTNSDALGDDDGTVTNSGHISTDGTAFNASGSVNLASPTDLLFTTALNDMLAAAGYCFDEIKVVNPNGGNITLSITDGVDYDDTAGTLTLPAALFGQSNALSPLTVGNYTAEITFEDSDNPPDTLTFTCTFTLTETYGLTLTAGTGGSITAGSSGSYAPGAQINITAAANNGYAFKNWDSSNSGSFDNASSVSAIFTMPANATTVTANFEYIGGSNTSTSSSGGGSSHTRPAHTYEHITVYDQRVDYSIENATGTLTLSLTRGLLDSITKAAGSDVTHIALNLTGVSGVQGLDINSPPAWFAEYPGVTFPVQTGIGGVHLNSNAAAKFPAQNLTGTISLRTGSVKLSAKQSGKAVTWNSAVAPVVVFIPYALKEGADANTLVLYDKATGKTVPHSFYSTGRVYGAVNRPGDYEVKTATVNFTDTKGHWAKDDIAFAVSHNLITGGAATTFAPGTAITRADFLMALGKLSGADVSGYKTSSFTDVANDNPAMPYIEWAVKNGIVQGVGNNKFAPAAPITREEMAVMMVNYAKATGQPLPVMRQAVTFSDAAKISQWAKDAVQAVSQANIITGKPGNLYDPKGSATRAEASAILRRFAESSVSGRLDWVQTDKGAGQYI